MAAATARAARRRGRGRGRGDGLGVHGARGRFARRDDSGNQRTFARTVADVLRTAPNAIALTVDGGPSPGSGRRATERPSGARRRPAVDRDHARRRQTRRSQRRGRATRSWPCGRRIPGAGAQKHGFPNASPHLRARTPRGRRAGAPAPGGVAPKRELNVGACAMRAAREFGDEDDAAAAGGRGPTPARRGCTRCARRVQRAPLR